MLKEVSAKTGGDKSTTVTGNIVRCVHTTLHKASEKHFQLVTSFDFEGVSPEKIMQLASETLVIRWRHAFKNAEKVDESADGQIVKVKDMLKGKKPRMSKGEKLAKTLADMTPEEKRAFVIEQSKALGIEIVMPKQSFDEWMAEVNALLVAKLGVSAEDIPDYDYRQCYDADDSPEIAVESVIEDQGLGEQE